MKIQYETRQTNTIQHEVEFDYECEIFLSYDAAWDNAISYFGFYKNKANEIVDTTIYPNNAIIYKTHINDFTPELLIKKIYSENKNVQKINRDQFFIELQKAISNFIS